MNIKYMLIKAIAEKTMSYTELSRRSGVSRHSIARIVKGEVDPHLSSVQKLLDVLLEAKSIREAVEIAPTEETFPVGINKRYPPGTCVITPSGRQAVVERWVKGEATDGFERAICRYLDVSRGKKDEKVTLRPKLLRGVTHYANT